MDYLDPGKIEEALALMTRVREHVSVAGVAALHLRRGARKIFKGLLSYVQGAPGYELWVLQEAQLTDWEFQKVARKLRKEKRRTEWANRNSTSTQEAKRN